MKILHSYKVCPACDGAGSVGVVNPASLRQAREKKGVSLRQMARWLNFTAPYLSDIERGRRNCTKEIEEAYAKL